MRKAFTGLFLLLFFLCGNACAGWELLPLGYGLGENEYWDRDQVKSGGGYFIVPFMSNNPKDNTSSYILEKLDCLDGTETQLKWHIYSLPNLQGKKTLNVNKPFHFDVPALHDKLWSYLCKRDLTATYNRAHPVIYTPQQREIIKDMIRQNERQMLLDEIDDRINRRW